MSTIKELLCGNDANTVTTTTVTTMEITTDVIETMIAEHLELPDTSRVDFTWRVGQWPSLTVTVTAREYNGKR